MTDLTGRLRSCDKQFLFLHSHDDLDAAIKSSPQPPNTVFHQRKDEVLCPQGIDPNVVLVWPPMRLRRQPATPIPPALHAT